MIAALVCTSRTWDTIYPNIWIKNVIKNSCYILIRWKRRVLNQLFSTFNVELIQILFMIDTPFSLFPVQLSIRFKENLVPNCFTYWEVTNFHLLLVPKLPVLHFYSCHKPRVLIIIVRQSECASHNT